MQTVVAAVTTVAAKVEGLVVRCIRAAKEARMRSIQDDLEFRRSFDAYRAGKGIPPLTDLRSGS
jgi:hypothetical protein